MGWGKGLKILISWAFTEKSDFRGGGGGGGHGKPISRGELPKGGTWIVCTFKGRAAYRKRGGSVFKGV